MNTQQTKIYKHQQPFSLEGGGVLPEVEIAYNTWGNLNSAGDNVIWICHALTASADAAGWWPNMIGPGLLFDTNQFYVVCANILGSCYGTTGPVSLNPETGKAYLHTFPAITIKDMVKAHQILREHLSINNIHCLVGGSMGGYQALEWVLEEPALISKLVLLATSARESAWGIAIHTAQRLAIEADSTWNTDEPGAGKKGLIAARAFGMITYRNFDAYTATQSDNDSSKLDDYRASGYIIYQGNKLANRFNAYSYWLLTKSMDTHNICRGRTGSLTEVLQQVKQPVVVMGVSSDFLSPLSEMRELADQLPNARFHQLESAYGHDGFLVETKQITNILQGFISL